MVRITVGRFVEINGVLSRWYCCGKQMDWDSPWSAKHKSMPVAEYVWLKPWAIIGVPEC
jgi:hypothetical protein